MNIYNFEHLDLFKDLLLYRDVSYEECVHKVKDILINDKEFNNFLNEAFKTKERFAFLTLEEIIDQSFLFYTLIYTHEFKVYCKAIVNDFNNEHLLLLILTDIQKESWNKAKLALNHNYRNLLKTFEL